MEARALQSNTWNDLKGGSSSGDNNDTKALELGMSGLSMVSNLPSSVGRPPALSGSSISSAPEDNHHRHHSFGSISFPHSDSQIVHGGGSGPPSPSSPMARGVIGGIPPQFLPKPPGLSSLPSPIGKSSGYSSTTANSSLNLSSPAANLGDSYGYQGSPFESNISPWADYSAYNNVSSSYGNGNHDADSFDRSEDPDDGLMGLGALRERSLSSPGPVTGGLSSSPPVRIDVNPYYQGDLSPLPTDGDRFRGLPPDPRRRTVKLGSSGSSRPPLSGQGANHPDNSSFHTFSGRNSPGSYNNTESLYDYSSLGNGGRSDMAERLQGRSRSITLGASMGEQIDPNRSVHGEQFRHVHHQAPQQQQHHHLDPLSYTNKFGNLPSLSNIHQHQMRHQQMPPQTNRHIRSYSHSGPLQQYGDLHDDRRLNDQHLQQHHPHHQHQRLHSDGGTGSDGLFSGDNLYNFRGSHQSNRDRSFSSGDYRSSYSAQSVGVIPRSISMSQTILPQSFENYQPLQRRNSDNLLGGGSGPYRQNHPTQHRREEMFGDSNAPAPIMATAEELRAFNVHDDHSVRHPASQRYQSQVTNMGIQQRHGEYGVGMITGGRYAVQHQDHRGSMHGSIDDDLTHPLAGEHIDDPGDELGFGHLSGIMSGTHQQVSFGRANDMTQLSQHMSRSPPVYSVHHQPVSAIHRLVYTIKFKRTQRSFILGPRVSQDLKIGCYVKVEADRGEDLGIVVGKVPADKFNATAGRANFRELGGAGALMGAPIPPSGIADLKRIIRLATHDEVGLLAVKRDEEEELLNICRQKVRQRALPMHVVDAEYQFDRHKLTFFFEAEGRIDFRELVRDLFSIYKTRIWMQQLDKNSNAPVTPTGSMSPVTDYANQVPVMADSINDPYGIPSDLGAGNMQHA